MPKSTMIPETASPYRQDTTDQKEATATSTSISTSPSTETQTQHKRTLSPAGVIGYSTPKSYTYEVSPQFYKRVCDSDDLWTRTKGAAALLMLWVVWIAGSFCLFWWPYLVLKGYYMAAWATALIMAYPYVFTVQQSPAFIRFILSGAGWFQGGTCLYIEESLKKIDTSQSVLLCQHPHGLFTYGFIQNGSAARIDARRPEVYVPEAFRHMKPNAVALVEPLLFKVPLIRHFIQAFGSARPATKKMMYSLMENKIPFGLLPGGSEEIILSHHGHERVYIKKRKGFIKYALQYGYTIAIGYTFGESDSYRTLDWGRGFRMWLLKNFKVPSFACWGIWWCPLLPRGKVALETVVGNPFVLPKIAAPTQADIDKYHAMYVEKLVDLFERNKAKFGYGERVLEIY